MPNALDVFREQQKAAGLVYERVRQVSGLLAAVREQVDGLTRNDEFRQLLRDEQRWLAEVRQTVTELRCSREREMLRFWPGVFRRWLVALAFALTASWLAGAGYAWFVSPYAAELSALRSRLEAVDSLERRVLTMTPAERRQLDKLLARDR